MKNKKKIPFGFIVDYLFPLDPVIKPMFGCYAVYVGEKLVFILHDRKDHSGDNGIWIATDFEHHYELMMQFPSLKYIGIFGPRPSKWLLLPVDSNGFEELAVTACDMVKNGDPRIGRVPNSRERKKKPVSTIKK